MPTFTLCNRFITLVRAGTGILLIQKLNQATAWFVYGQNFSVPGV